MSIFNVGDLLVLRIDQVTKKEIPADKRKPLRTWKIVEEEGRTTIIHASCPLYGNPIEAPESDWELYPEDHPFLWDIRNAVSLLGIMLGFASCGAALLWTSTKWLMYTNAIFWTLGPPLWFMAEYTLLAPRLGNPRLKAELQYGQGLASKFWLGVGSLLVIIYKGAM